MSSDGANEEAITPATVKRLFLLSALPFLGFVMVVAGAILGFTDFNHNNTLNCGEFSGFPSAPGCTHHSYAVAIVLGVLGVVVMMGSAIFASYYATRRIGLPLISALLQRRQSRDLPVTPPPGE